MRLVVDQPGEIFSRLAFSTTLGGAAGGFLYGTHLKHGIQKIGTNVDQPHAALKLDAAGLLTIATCRQSVL